jgi:hypothetical protein
MKTPQLFSSIFAASLFLIACNQNPAPITPATQPSATKTALPTATPQPQATAIKPIVNAGLALDLTQGRGVIGGQLFDAKTQMLLKSPVKLSVTGPDSNKIEKTQFETQNGLFSLVLKSGVEPALNQPIRVTVVAEAEGFFSASAGLNITDRKHDAFVLKLVNQKDAPAGVGTADAQTDASAGKLNQALNISANENQSKSLASFALKAGTELKDASGQALSGKIQTHIGYFSNTTPGSLGAFPGGFAPQVSQNGLDSNGYFITGGFVSVDMVDQSGRKASQFSQPAEVTIQIPQGTRNPETGKVIANGDTIGIWSHDPRTGKWSGEGQGKVTGPESNGHFNVSYQASHLSYWNIDWHNSAVCNPKVLLNWDSPNRVGVRVSLQFEGQDWYTPSNILSDPENQLFNVPINKRLNFIAKYNEKELGSTQVTLDQGCADVTLQLQTASLPAMHRLPVELSLSGQTRFTRQELSDIADQFGLSSEIKTKVLNYTHPADPNLPFQFSDKALIDLEALGAQQIRELKSMVETKIRPTTYLYYKKADPNDWEYQWAMFESGKAELSLVDNQSYEFSGVILYNDQWYNINQTVKVSPEMKTLVLDMQNAQLTVNAVRSYLSGLLKP